MLKNVKIRKRPRFVYCICIIILFFSTSLVGCKSQSKTWEEKEKQNQIILENYREIQQEKARKAEENNLKEREEITLTKIAYLDLLNGYYAPGNVSYDEKTFFKWKVLPITMKEIPWGQYHTPRILSYSNIKTNIIEVDIPARYKYDTSSWKRESK